jgi:hypothetical protein
MLQLRGIFALALVACLGATPALAANSGFLD